MGYKLKDGGQVQLISLLHEEERKLWSPRLLDSLAFHREQWLKWHLHLAEWENKSVGRFKNNNWWRIFDVCKTNGATLPQVAECQRPDDISITIHHQLHRQRCCCGLYQNECTAELFVDKPTKALFVRNVEISAMAGWVILDPILMSGIKNRYRPEC